MTTAAASPAVDLTKATSSGTTPAPAGTDSKAAEEAMATANMKDPTPPFGDLLGETGSGGAGANESMSGTGTFPLAGQELKVTSSSGAPPAGTPPIEADPASTDSGLHDDGFEEHIAEVCHEANRAYCSMNGDQSQPRWKDAPEWQRSSAILGVRNAQAGNTPRQSHESWAAQKLADGWKFGAEKNPDAKTHPCLVEYDKLSEEQRAKDIIFVSIVRALTSMRDSA